MRLRAQIAALVSILAMTVGLATSASAASDAQPDVGVYSQSYAPTLQLSPSATVYRAMNSSAVKPQMIQWEIFESNIANEAKCNALLIKMKRAYPSSYHWMCEPYETSACPPVTRWALFFGENGV